MGEHQRPTSPYVVSNRRITRCATVPSKILVVDDMEDNVLSLQLLLQKPDLQVLIATSATTALEMLTQHEVALALLDVQMPGIDGFELAERMRHNQRTRTTPIIFLTGNPAEASRSFMGYAAGAVDYLIKPVHPRVLECKVWAFVNLYQQRRDLLERNTELNRLLKRTEAAAQALRKAHGQAMHDACTDVLTGVANRRHIMRLGEAAINDRRRNSQPLSVAILDLDHFKNINDTHGHDFGDAVLSAFCNHVSSRIRPPHMLGRLGGEEFLLLMPGTSLVEAEVVLERVHRSLQPHDEVQYTFCAGIAQAGPIEILPALVKRADDALYEAKRNGRDQSITSQAPQ